jgi:site-specific DNA recombinase
MGRLVLNVLLSFAQFEREMISERTRDKIAAARRKGKWSGGMPILGYTVEKTKLVVDEAEANHLRQIFELYLDHQSLLLVVKELNARGWRTKRWTTKKGKACGGRQFDKNRLYQLLTNVAYVGKVRYKDEVHPGEHQAIVAPDVFARVQKLLEQNGRSGGRAVRNKHGALLRGLLRCAACDCGMSHSYSSNGKRTYRYYVCNHAQKRGWDSCPAPSVPAGEIERFVVDQIKCIGRDARLSKETLVEARRQAEQQIERLRAEAIGLRDELRNDHAELGRRAATSLSTDPRLADAHDRIREAEHRLTAINDELATLEGELVDETEVAAALADFDALWDCLAPREQARMIELLVERVDYHGGDGNVSIGLRPSGIKILVGELANRKEEAA